VWFDATDVPPLLVENFPFDKYELEPSPLTQYILEKRNAATCWQVRSMYTSSYVVDNFAPGVALTVWTLGCINNHANIIYLLSQTS